MAYNKFCIVATTVLLVCDIRGLLGSGWYYGDTVPGELGPDDWKYNYSACAGSKQSPININTANLEALSKTLTFTGYDKISTSSFSVENNGHTIQVNVNDPTIGVTVSSSPLNGNYALEQFHFHWSHDTKGSEHSVDAKFFPVEIHFVHYNKDKYTSVADAKSHNDSAAILVVGVFGTESDEDASSGIETLTNMYNKVNYGSNKTVISSFQLKSLLPCGSSTVYTYSGSLTTPDCSEVVNWNVFAQPIHISSEELKKFRELHGDDSAEELDHNFRPIQALNGRTVYSYSATACTPSAASTTALNGRLPITILFAAVIVALLDFQFRNRL